MTTLAYRAGVLAGDTRHTAGGHVIGHAPKVFRIGGALVGFCGDSGLGQRFVRWVKDGMKGDPPSLREGDVGANVVLIAGPNIIVRYVEDLPPSYCQAEMFTDGSGGDVAMGAMLAGKAAEDAVRIAAMDDTRTGAEVVSVSL